MEEGNLQGDKQDAACAEGGTGGTCAQLHLVLPIFGQTSPYPLLSLSPPIPPSLPVQWQLYCPQRDDWECVALPLQSYRSTAAGVSSSALPLCSRYLSLTCSLFPLSSLARKVAAATHWLVRAMPLLRASLPAHVLLYRHWIPLLTCMCLPSHARFRWIFDLYNVVTQNNFMLQEFPPPR